MTYRQFETYLDAYTYLLREESDEGRKANRRDDMKALAEDEEIAAMKERELQKAKERLSGLKKGHTSGS